MSNLSRTPGAMPDRPSMEPAEAPVREAYESSAQRRASFSARIVKEEAKALGIDTRGKLASVIRKEVLAVQKVQNDLGEFALMALNKKIGNAGESAQRTQSPMVQSSGSHSDPVSPFLHDSARAPQAVSGAAKAALRPFELVDATSGNPAVASIQVMPSTLYYQPPTGMVDPAVDFFLTPISGTQMVYGRLTIDITTFDGPPVSTAYEILQAATVPVNTNLLFHVLIGSYVLTAGVLSDITNYRYGPIDGSICRNWFVTEAPFYGVTFFGP